MASDGTGGRAKLAETETANFVSAAVCPSPPLSTEITVLKGSTIHHRLCLADDVCQHRPAGPGRAAPGQALRNFVDGSHARRDRGGTEAVFESKFMLPWSFSEEAAAEKYMPQLQHNMWVTHLRTSALSIITGGGKWMEIAIPMDPLYLSVLVSAEKKFWRCVQSGEVPHLVLAEPPRPRIEAIRIIDMSASNSWAEFAGLFRNTRSAFLEHERAKSELKALMPEDAKEAIGHGVKAKRSKSGAASFDLLQMEGATVKHHSECWSHPPSRIWASSQFRKRLPSTSVQGSSGESPINEATPASAH
jgi:hypothetical protein